MNNVLLNIYALSICDLKLVQLVGRPVPNIEHLHWDILVSYIEAIFNCTDLLLLIKMDLLSWAFFTELNASSKYHASFRFRSDAVFRFFHHNDVPSRTIFDKTSSCVLAVWLLHTIFVHFCCLAKEFKSLHFVIFHIWVLSHSTTDYYYQPTKILHCYVFWRLPILFVSIKWLQEYLWSHSIWQAPNDQSEASLGSICILPLVLRVRMRALGIGLMTLSHSRAQMEYPDNKKLHTFEFHLSSRLFNNFDLVQ